MTDEGKQEDFSVIIVSYDTRERTLACLRSLIDHTGELRLQIIVVDNASMDGTADAIQRHFPQVDLILNSENVGFGRANNFGLTKARARLVLFLNSDTLVHSNTLSGLKNVFQEQPDVGAAGPRLLGSDGAVQHSVYGFPNLRAFLYSDTILRAFGIFRQHFVAFRRADFDYGTAQNVEHIKAAALAVRREVLEEVGGFDPAFFMYYEDLDLCLQIHHAGYKLRYVPDCTITHFGKESARKTWRDAYLASRVSSLIYLRKHNSAATMRWFLLVYRPLTLANAVADIIQAAIKWPYLKIVSRDSERTQRTARTLVTRLAYLSSPFRIKPREPKP